MTLTDEIREAAAWVAGRAKHVQINADAIDAYQPFHAARADLLARGGRVAEALDAYDRAIELTANPAEADFLRRRRSAVT